MSAMNVLSAYAAEGFASSSHDHAAGSGGFGDLIIAAISIIIVVVTLFLCVRYFLYPEENEDTHIKKRILDDEVQDDRGLHHE